VNRPHESISFDDMVRGLVDLRDRFGGEIWLEVMLLAGVTGIDSEVRKIAGIVEKVRADRVQLNTAVRPTAEDFALALSAEEMDGFARLVGAGCEVIADFRGIHEAARFRRGREDVLALLRRRPCTLEDIAAALGMHMNEATKYVGELQHEEKIVMEAHHGAPYYRAKADLDPS